MRNYKYFILLIPALIGLGLNQADWLNNLQSITISITLLTAILWMTEWLPIPVSSLLPLALFPLTSILSTEEIAQAYGNPMIILLLGGFLLSMAMSHTNTHQLLAYQIIRVIGNKYPHRILLSLMLSSFLLSMWISNTATTLMLLPIALAIIERNNDKRFTIIVLLGIAYSASIGGIGTPIGTPPNLIMINHYQETFGHDIGFADWMIKVMPVLLIFFPITYLFLKSKLPREYQSLDIDHQKITTAQKRTLIIFIITATLWVTRTTPYGGWKNWLEIPYANDASIALLAVIALFSISDGNGKKLLNWKTANQIPWGVLLLFASGIAIALAFQKTGVSHIIAEQLSFLKMLPSWFIVLTVCLGITFLTEITSNTATTAIVIPILSITATAMEVPPLQLMLPAAISASCAFMLPVATAPNAIIYGSNRVPIHQMIRHGIGLNIIGAIVITIVYSWLI